MSEERVGEKVEKIQKLEKVQATTPGFDIAQNAIATDPLKTKFDNAFAKANVAYIEPVQTEQIQPNRKPSLIDELGLGNSRTPITGPATIDSIQNTGNQIRTKLQTQIDNVNSTSEQVDKFLEERPDAKININPVHESQLSGKIVHIESALKSVLRTAGVEVNPQIESRVTGSMKNPLVKFLNYLTQNDQQMGSMLDEINSINVGADKPPLTAGEMLAIQAKLGFIQQQLEMFSGILNKALESVKTVMNVQV